MCLNLFSVISKINLTDKIKLTGDALMKSSLIIKDLNQLKILSDPFRAKLMMFLIEKPYTGQQLAEKVGLSRARIHYHLRELEKNHLIELVRKEEINGIVQKFYRSVAHGFLPDVSLLPHKKDVDETYRQIVLSMIDRTRAFALSAPEEAFSFDRKNDERIEKAQATYMIGKMTEEHFIQCLDEYQKLMKKFDDLCKNDEKDSCSKTYILSRVAFQVDESQFSLDEEKKEGN